MIEMYVQLYLRHAKTKNVYLFISLFLMHSYSFEQICTKFGMWHPYTLQMVTGGQQPLLEPANSRSTRRLYAAANEW